MIDNAEPELSWFNIFMGVVLALTLLLAGYALIHYGQDIVTARQTDAGYPYTIYSGSGSRIFQCEALDAEKEIATNCRTFDNARHYSEYKLAWNDTWGKR